MEKEKYIINGNNFSTLEEFFDEISKVLIPNAKWGKNLDAFNDILSGGFGTPENGFILEWKHSSISKLKLYYPETVRQLELQLKHCHPTNAFKIKTDIELAKQNIGETVFEWLTKIINDHNNIVLLLE